MARLARVVLPNYPHHIIQRGNRGQDAFFCEDDYLEYLNLLKEWCHKTDVEIWAYCLMTNHVHLILTPGEDANLTKAIAETHRRYTRMINFREKWCGFLWQGRFLSYPMEKNYLLNAMAYVELNPVKAKMAKYAWKYRWSSAQAHVKGRDPLEIIDASKLLKLCGDWKTYLKQCQPILDSTFESHLSTGRPLGSEDFLIHAEQLLGRELRKKKPGPKGKQK